jgi:tripartite-type tricarboxylate transporter receptor subunit TctC
MRRTATLALATALIVGIATQVFAFPDRPLRAIVPFDPGGSTDLMMRALQEPLSRELGQPVVIVNRPGAASTIGAAEVMNTRPDGYGFGMLTLSSLALVPHTRSVPYGHDRFDFLCQVYETPTLLMVAPNSPLRSVADVVAAARARPETLFYGSPGPGSLNHMAMAGFLHANSVQGTHVPFTGVAPMNQALVAGQITVVADSALSMRAHELRPLAVFGPARIPDLPDVPSLAELGGGFDATIWGGLVAPTRLAPEVRARLEQACERAVGGEGFAQVAERLASRPRHRGGQEFRDYVLSEFARYGEFIAAMGLARSN